MNANLFRTWLERDAASMRAVVPKASDSRRTLRAYQSRLDHLNSYTSAVDCELSFRYVLCVVHEWNPTDDRHSKMLDVCVREALDGTYGDDIA